MKKNLLLFFDLGIFYILVEVIFRVVIFDVRNVSDQFKYFSLIGYTSLWMLPVGGLAGLVVGLFNNNRWINKHLNIFCQSLIGSLFILILEFIAGFILNVELRLNLWDYSSLPFNLLGQISLVFWVIWFIICPLIMWADDMLRYYLYKEGETYSLLDIYKQFINPFSKPFI